MNIKQAILNWWNRLRIKAYYTIVAPGAYGYAQSRQFNYKTAADEGFKQVVWVFRCAVEIANRVSSVPWGVYRKNKKDENELLPDHPLNSLLLFPNAEQSWKEFLEAWIIYLFVSGNDYLEKGNKPRPNEIYLLRPDRIQIVPSKDPNKRIDYYQYDVDGSTYKIPPEEIVHYKYIIDPTNDWYGLSPLFAAGRTIDTENYAVDWNKNMFINQARPYGFLHTDQELSDDAFNRLKSEIQTNWQGSSNAFKPGLLEKGLKWIQAQLNQQEADYLGLKRMNREEICAAMGVPPVIVGILDKATYSNFEQAEKTLWYQTCIPALRKFRDLFNHSVASGFGDNVFINYNLKHIQALQESEESLFTRADKGFKGGFMTRNESRNLVGLEPVSNGDIFIIPGSFVEVAAGSKPADSKRFEKVQILNLQSDKARAEYLDDVETAREKWIEKGKSGIAKILKEHYRKIAKAIAAAERVEASNVLNIDRIAFEEKVTGWYVKFYSDVIKEFGNKVIKDFYSSLKSRTKDQVPKFDSFSSMVTNWIQTMTGERIKEVSDTTIQQVKAVVDSGIQQGWTMAEISAKIFEIAEINSLTRADLIAVTETVSLSNAGSYFGVKQLPFSSKLKKRWVASFVNTRETHAAAHNQVKNMDDAFSVGGAYLMFPGDSSLGAPAREICNCRCTQVYDTTEAGGIVGADTTFEELEAGL